MNSRLEIEISWSLFFVKLVTTILLSLFEGKISTNVAIKKKKK